MKKCIVSFANGNSNYIKGLARLGESLRTNFDGDFLGFISEGSIGAPLHSKQPYAFKIYAIERALNAGYDQILWLDSSCFAIKNVQPIFDEITTNGFIFQEAGHMLGTWTNDFTLNYFGITRDEALEIPMIGNAGFLGFEASDRTFFALWRGAMNAGCFNGAWDNKRKTESLDERCQGHRHDMSCSSALVHELKLTHLIKPGNEWLQYAGVFDETANDTIIIKAQGA